MTEDTTSWLKKNPATNPLRRSLKTSLRFHINASEMDASMSNPDNAKGQPIPLPRLLQRPSMRMKMLQSNEFKVPKKMSPINKVNSTVKPNIKQGSNCNSKKKIEPRKSLLPVKNRPQSTEKTMCSITSIVRPSFHVRSSARKTNFRLELIQKMVEASQKQLTTSNSVDADGSVVRSILKKKRNSLRKNMDLSVTNKPKAMKKVLFQDFGNVHNSNKENFVIPVSPISKQSECDLELTDEPTVFLNFPKSKRMESSPVPLKQVETSDNLDSSALETSQETTNVTALIETWRNYMEKLDKLQSMRNAIGDSLKIHVEQNLTMQNEFNVYMKTCNEMYEELSRLGKEVENNIKTIQNVHNGGRLGSNSAEKKSREKKDKIKLSDKSKTIKRNSTGRTTGLTSKSGIWREDHDEFALVETKGAFSNRQA